MTVVATKTPDFTGYATRFNVECSDGRTIKHSAFRHQDGQQVQLVWQHMHDSPSNVLGHAFLYQREDGIYTEAFFNETQAAKDAKELIRHGDVKALSIFANRLKQSGADVVHGNIVEVSLVYKGANPEAHIQDVNLQHSADGSDTMVGEVIIYSGEEFSIAHSVVEDSDEELQHMDVSNVTVADVVNSLSPIQRDVVFAIIADATSGGSVAHGEDHELVLEHASGDGNVDIPAVIHSLSPLQRQIVNMLIGVAIEDASVAHSDDESGSENEDNSEESNDSEDSEKLQHNQEGSANMSKYSAFETGATGGTAVKERYTLSHSDIVEINDLAKEKGSFKKAYESFQLAHADYGITSIDILFPDARVSSQTPELIARQTEWVQKVLSATKHSPFAKVKTILADLTAEEARAKGYVKGTMKKEEVVPLMQRSTSPATVYKKQKLDRDDIIDITDMDIVSWLKWEIRFMLDEEIARAILIGDGRNVGNPDKIKDPQGQTEGTGIRSIANDHELYAHPVQLAANVAPGVMIDEITRSRTNYRGSGSPTFYTTDAVITEMLLLKDKMGRRLYETEASLAAAIRVKEIVPVEPMSEDPTLLGIIVNLVDYTVGSTKGGEITSFEDFDIDFNQYKYLMETRLSGALTKPKSALVIRRNQGTEAIPAAPTFVSGTNTLTIPITTGVDYLIDGNIVAAGDIVITETTDVYAEAKAGFYLKDLSTRHWVFTYTA